MRRKSTNNTGLGIIYPRFPELPSAARILSRVSGYSDGELFLSPKTGNILSRKNMSSGLSPEFSIIPLSRPASARGVLARGLSISI
jgi:hypothetical protein